MANYSLDILFQEKVIKIPRLFLCYAEKSGKSDLNLLIYFIIWLSMFVWPSFVNLSIIINVTQPVKIDLNEKLDHKQKTIQAFNIDA